MTGGRAVILGKNWKEFWCRGMSGGIAYVYNPNQDFVLKAYATHLPLI